ncbi:tetratricopeptide repeat protein (macronuclear) [Tetrahymena thermophila SB210]|uniref:Tetratricopeptide repeat protein n=1 Tax=Tetrahymena thermophila (strain SB210) TaxID=312017 RepID=I7LUT6_TETTS|nr:tetratricopeptide repeat protein [Tetrahymena thermophila SB210]EAR96013.2 tetratricopeptide repeat protein [Tetrahymena thermophila SB210]|eukprot:XP_001016258.2 tetratricopeptide repeat protein [Tetrahymena thermophila SB210]
MKLLIIRLIVTVSIPLITGVAIVLSIFYQSLWLALDSWEQDSLLWINSTQKQILHNSVISMQYIEEHSFTQLQLHLIISNNLIQKYYKKMIKINPSSRFLKCSYRELVFNECPREIYVKLNQSIFYLDLYFVRDTFQFNKLTAMQQEFILMNEFISYYGRAATLASFNNQLLKIQTFYNSDTTSILAHIPSRYENFTNSDYENCFGDNFIEPFDPRCRSWYLYAQQHEGYFFYEPYLDAVEGNLEMTLSSQIVFNSEFKSVNSIDLEMSSFVDLFKTSVSKNSYPVLFHEFNNKVFYHPLLLGSNIKSWEDLEFQNITIYCKDSIEVCNIEKQIFSQMLNQTVQFIQKGNYSIQENINTDNLYQYWTKYNVKQISLVYPINSLIQKYKTQQPYSKTIILTAKVMNDISDSLKLFNILDTNIIRIPLLIEFILLSASILIFIVRYGQFQIYQVQYPIQLLIKFLEYSLKEQQHFHEQITQKKQNLNTQLPSTQKKQQNCKKILNKSEYDEKNNLEEQKSFFLFHQKDLNSQILIRSRINRRSREEQQLQQSKMKLLTRKNLDEIDQTFEKSNNSYEFSKSQYQSQIFNSNNNSFTPNYNRKIQQGNQNFQDLRIKLHNFNEDMVFSSITESQQSHDNKIRKDKILQGLKPLFLEMKIIKQTFQMLESVLNYQIDAYSKDSNNNLNTLFHFTKAKSTFQQLKNQTGVSRCYFNLGIIYLLNQEYSLACQYFESAIYLNSQIFDIVSLCNIQEKILQNLQSQTEEQLFIFCKRIFTLAYTSKQFSFQTMTKEQDNYQANQSLYFTKQIIHDKLTNQYSNDLTKMSQTSYQYLMKALELYLILEKIILNKSKCFSKTFIIYLYLEIYEIFIQLSKQDSIQAYFQIINQLIQKPSYPTVKNIQLKSYLENKIVEEKSKFFQDESTSTLKNQNTFQLKVNQEQNQIILEILRSKFKYLQGLSEKGRKNYYTASLFLTQCLEEGIHYSPFLRVKAIQNLKEIFQINQLKQQDYFSYVALQEEENQTPFDIFILIQLDCVFYTSTYESCLENLKRQKFFKQNDRLQAVIFHEELSICIPLTKIQSDHHWQLMIDSIKLFGRDIFYQQKEKRQQISWQQALFSTFDYLCDLNIEDFQNLNKIYKKNFVQNKQENQSQKRQKCILLFSKQHSSKKISIPQKLINNQNILSHHKPYVFHLNELLQVSKEIAQQIYEHIYYEQFTDENKFISNIISIRQNDHFKEEQEHLSIINNC